MAEIFGQPARRQPQQRSKRVLRRAPSTRDYTPIYGPGAVVDAPDQFMVGPGGVVGGSGRDTRTQIQRDQQSADAADFGVRAGQLANRSRYRAQLPDTAAAPQDSFPVGPGGVVGGVSTTSASAATGTPQGYLDALVGQESGGDPSARAPTSSATGLAQFTDQTWLAMMHRYAGRYGHPDIADAITVGANGVAKVADRTMQRAVLDLRLDPTWSSLMAGHFANENEADLRARLGRRVREGEVYLAHFLGSADAAALIRAAENDRGADRGGRAAYRFVDRASVEANRNIFYDEKGRPRSARDVVALQSRNFRRDVFMSKEPQR